MSSRDAIHIAVIGAGSEGARLLSALAECPSASIVGFCNCDGDSAGVSIAQELSIPLCERIEQLPSMGAIDIIVDISDSAAAPGSLEGLDHIEIIRGSSASVIKTLAEKNEEYNQTISNILESGLELASQKDSRSIYRAIVENAIKIANATTGTLVIFDEKNESCRLAEVIGYSKNTDRDATWELSPGGISEQLLDREQPLLIPDITQEPLFDNPVMNESTVAVLATALREADEVIGLLFVGDFQPRSFSDREVALFYTFAGQASLALQKALLLERNEELTTTDTLTGFHNSRNFYTTLDTEVNRAKRYASHFSLLLMDMDNLDTINSELGHARGDWAIKKVASIIQSCSRQTDYKARFGGDEFAVILPYTSCQQASVLANRIRRQIHDVIAEGNGQEARLSISIGIAEFPGLGFDSDSLVSAVHTALTICKQRGRNLVCCYENSDE